MPTSTIARTECRRHLRGKGPWIVALCFIVFSRVTTQPEPAAAQIIDNAISLIHAQPAVVFIVPFAAAIINFRAITRERESGTARILLGTKTTRPRLVLGMVLGRGTALLVPVLAATVLIIGYDTFQYGQFSPLLSLGFLALSTAYVFAWTGLIVGLSAASSSTTRAVILGTIATIGLTLWNGITLPFIWQVTTGTAPGSELAHPKAFAIAGWLSPASAFQVLTNWLFNVPIGTDVAVTQVADAITQSGEFAPTPPPFSPWWALGFLLTWPALTLASGVVLFQRGDLAPGSQSEPFRRLLNAVPSMPRLSGPRFQLPAHGYAIDSLPGSWQPLARREFHRVARSPLVWVAGGLVFVTAFLSLSQPTHVQEALGSRVPLAALQTPLAFIGGTSVLFGTFRSVIHDRDTGAIRFTAGTATSRMETLVGFTLGRAAAFAVPMTLAVTLTCLVAIPQHGVVSIAKLAVFLSYTVLFVTIIAGIGVSLSTILRSQAVAGFAVLIFTAVHFTWFQLSNTLYELISGTSVSGFTPPNNPLYMFIRWLAPFQLSNVVTNAIIGVPNSAAPAATAISELQPNQVTNQVVVRLQYGSDVPVWYLHPSVAFTELLLWALVPLTVAVALYRHRSID